MRGRFQQRPTDPSPTVPNKTKGEVICTWVRNGAFEAAAAACEGVTPEELREWVKSGEKKRNRVKLYAEFARRLRMAKAQARVQAEISVHDTDPKTWLRNGPGKETEGNPGWTSIVKPMVGSHTTINMLASPEWNGVWATVLRVLSAYPEARQALVEAMQSQKEPRKPKVVEALPPTTTPPAGSETEQPSFLEPPVP
jgi:hypothetical protein